MPECAAPRLRLLDGATGDFSEVTVRCTCGAGAPLSSAMQPGLLKCRGARPWLDDVDPKGCAEHQRLLVRTASNAYFSQVVSALSIPDASRALSDAVGANWDVLANATERTLGAFRTIPKVARALGSATDEAVLAAVQARLEGARPPSPPLRSAEYAELLCAPPEVPGELPPVDEHLHARRIRCTGEMPAGIGRVVALARLREVRVRVGFTRLEPATADLQGEYDLNVTSAPLGLHTSWLPATEIHGEGVFIELDAQALAAWEARPAVRQREDALKALEIPSFS